MMTIYAVSAVSIHADCPYHADIVSYHKTLESANKAAKEIDKQYQHAKEKGWLYENGSPISEYTSGALVTEITVID